MDATFQCLLHVPSELHNPFSVHISDGTKYYLIENVNGTNFTVDGTLFDASVFGKQLLITARDTAMALTLKGKSVR